MKKLLFALLIAIGISALAGTVPVETLPGGTPVGNDYIVFYHNAGSGYVAYHGTNSLYLTNGTPGALIGGINITNDQGTPSLEGGHSQVLLFYTDGSVGLFSQGGPGVYMNGTVDTTHYGSAVNQITVTDGNIETANTVTLDDGSGDGSWSGSLTANTIDSVNSVSGTSYLIGGTTTIIDSAGDFLGAGSAVGISGQIFVSQGGGGDIWTSWSALVVTPKAVATTGSHTPGRLTLTASPMTWSNPNADTINVFATNTANFTVAVNGVTVSTGTSFYGALSASSSITITYATAPAVYTNAW